jgi:outer membrane protein assembly factor BamB
MAQKRVSRLSGLIFLLVCCLLMSSCGKSNKSSQTNTQTPKAEIAPIYVVNDNGVTALDANNGQSLWQFEKELFYSTSSGNYEPAPKIKTHLAVLADQTLVVSGKDALYGVDAAKGTELWKKPWPAEASSGSKLLQLYTSKKMVYATVNNLLYAFEAKSGILKWRVENVVAQWISDDLLVVFLYDGTDYKFEALDLTSGSELWSKAIKEILPDGLKLPNNPSTSKKVPPVKFSVLSGQILVVATGDQQVFALDATNSGVLWKKTFKDQGWSDDIREVAAINDVLYLVGNDNGSVIWANNVSDGQQLWSVKAPDFKQDIVAATDRAYSPNISINEEGIFSIAGPTKGDIEARNFTDGSINWTILGTSSFDMIQADKKIVYAVSKDNDAIAAFRMNDQKQLWTLTSNGDFALYNGVPYATAVDEKQTSTKFSALDPLTGKILWTADILGDGFLNVIGSTTTK